MLELSLAANVMLSLAVFIIVRMAKRKIVHEKLATFSGCLAGVALGLAIEEIGKRFNAVGHGFATLHKRSDEAEANMIHYLSRAAMLRPFRKASLADIGEHLHLLAIQTAGDDDEVGSDILEYIGQSQPGDAEPREIWGDEVLASAGFVAEKKALLIYAKQITSVPLSIWR